MTSPIALANEQTVPLATDNGSAPRPLKVGLIGVGNISPAYIRGCRAFDILDLAACADLDEGRARAVAAEHTIPQALTVEALLADPEIEAVVNLTVPAVHAQVSLQVLRAGKHVYSEKPLATMLDDARQILQVADQHGLRVGCAPDTFLFVNHQTARKAIDDGAIGMPFAAFGSMAWSGPEAWHPNPDFFYAPGAGPMLDMGPYYVTCLVNLLGPAVRVSGTAKATYPERTAGDGHKIPVYVPTYYAGQIEFASGAVATLIITFDVPAHHLPQLEVYGSAGSLTIPDPNGYEPREVKLFVKDKHDWDALPLPRADDWVRGIGLADMAYGIRYGRPHRATGELAAHVLEIMGAFERAMQTGTYIEIESRPEQPRPVPLNLPPRVLDI